MMSCPSSLLQLNRPSTTVLSPIREGINLQLSDLISWVKITKLGTYEQMQPTALYNKAFMKML